MSVTANFFMPHSSRWDQHCVRPKLNERLHGRLLPVLNVSNQLRTQVVSKTAPSSRVLQ